IHTTLERPERPRHALEMLRRLRHEVRSHIPIPRKKCLELRLDRIRVHRPRAGGRGDGARPGGSGRGGGGGPAGGAETPPCIRLPSSGYPPPSRLAPRQRCPPPPPGRPPPPPPPRPPPP